MNKIAFLGDIMPGGVLDENHECFSDTLISYISQFDYRVGTLECALGTNKMTFDSVKMKDRCNVVYSPINNISKLINLKVDAVNLANNHIYDLGIEGLKETILILEQNNIKYFGAGLNKNEASKPLIVNLDNIKISFIGACASRHVGYIPIASYNSAGVNFLDPIDIVEQIKRAKQTSDFVFLVTHWGEENTFWPHIDLVEMANIFVSAGVDAIVGGHSHQVQPVVLNQNTPIFYSLGNFLFPDFFINPPRPIAYPKDSEKQIYLKNTIYNYPFPIQKKTYRKWPKIGTIGMIGELECNDNRQVLPSYSFVILQNNYLDLKSDMSFIKLKLSLIGFFTKNKYSYFYKVHVFCKKVIRKLKALLCLNR